MSSWTTLNGVVDAYTAFKKPSKSRHDRVRYSDNGDELSGPSRTRSGFTETPDDRINSVVAIPRPVGPPPGAPPGGYMPGPLQAPYHQYPYPNGNGNHVPPSGNQVNPSHYYAVQPVGQAPHPGNQPYYGQPAGYSAPQGQAQGASYASGQQHLAPLAHTTSLPTMHPTQMMGYPQNGFVPGYPSASQNNPAQGQYAPGSYQNMTGGSRPGTATRSMSDPTHDTWQCRFCGEEWSRRYTECTCQR